MAIPLVTMLGLFADVAYTSVENFVNLDRAPSLIRTTSTPMSAFMDTLQAERRAAFVYQSAPTATNKTTYQAAISNTDSMNASPNGPFGLGYVMAAINAAGTKGSATPAETAAITKLLGAVTGSPLQNLRAGVNGNAIPAITAFQDYTTIIDGIPAVFQSEASSMTNATAALQGSGLIETILAREDIDQQDALLAGALASGTLTVQERVGFEQAAGREQDDEALYTKTLSGPENAAFNNTFNSYANGAAATLDKKRLTIQQGVEAGLPLAALQAQGLNSTTWQAINANVAAANFQGGTAAANASLNQDQGIANSAERTVIITGVFGFLGLILSLILTIVLARSINRRLTTLRRQALLLAQEHLPSVVSRLRRGEPVDADAEAAPLRVGNDEIGQVGQAFDAVRQTAIASAVEEARLRQGVNDVFRNLARRNQSLLQRQLTSLDQMERKATDPEVLDDLFKLDHLTTRMRRHAEGLIILSGAPPGRGWSAPVRLIDVMRGAVSEVEDYARVQVATQSRAALSGSAVTDVIHLLAELIENATSLSPPYTQVRVTGEAVMNGFAIEIEDRGLGLTPDRLAELNHRLANPPDVNPANTEQLGLFVVAQLARRHGIHVTLRPSPYGGTTAVALIPRQLIVDDTPAALTSGENPMVKGRSQRPALPSFQPAGADGGTGLAPGGGHLATGNGNGNGSAHMPATRPGFTASGTGAPRGIRAAGPAGLGSDATAGSPPDLDSIQISGNYSSGGYQSGSYPSGGYQSGGYPMGAQQSGGYPASGWQSGGYPASGPQSGGGYQPGGYQPPPAPAAPGRAEAGSRRERYAEDVPVVTGIPVAKDAAPPFDVFTPISRPGEEGGGHAPGAGGGHASADDPYTGGNPTYPPRDSRPESANGTFQTAGYGTIMGDGRGVAEGGDELAGLPRRVRQASLAPQLRDAGPQDASPEDPGVPPASAASLSDMRNTLSAMQRGWQQGRSQSAQRDTEGN
ncbi:MAG TPA: nitrate- and nitrite sensing domain-containing protein [Trebonia sp.]|nr:nitrate- and nitrite sensing domain-containing protein [Trebonia sp.]